MFFKIVNIAFKNLGRHKVKTILTSLSVVISVWVFIFIDGWLLGMKIDSERNIVNLETGAVKIYNQDFLESKDDAPMFHSIDNWRAIVSQLDSEGFNGVPRVNFRGTLLYNNREFPFNFYGMDTELSKGVFELHKHIEDGGSYIRDGEWGIVIGVKGAFDLGVKIGDTVNLYTTIDRLDDKKRVVRTPQVIPLKIVGLLNTNNPYINDKVAYMPLDILNHETFGLQMSDRVTEICIRKKNKGPADIPGKDEGPAVIRKTLKSTDIDGLSVVSWEEDAKDFLAIAGAKSKGTNAIVFFLFLISILGISNTMLMATLERTKEIGMIRSLGMTDGEVKLTFLIEASLIGLLGSSIGFILGFMSNIYMVNFGIDFSTMINAMGTDQFGYRVAGVYKGAWNWVTMFGSVIGATLISAIACITPVKRALKKEIAQAMRFE